MRAAVIFPFALPTLPSLLLSAFAAAASAQSPVTSPPLPPAPPDDAALRRAWGYLLPSEQDDVAAFLEAELAVLDTFQSKLVAHARSLEPRDLGLVPVDTRAPVYEPAVHAPAQPIPRRWLDDSDPQARSRRSSMLVRHPVPPGDNAWRYDWGARELRRTKPILTSDHTFENALAGLPPLADFAEALVESILDRGEEQAALAAFGHAYTDREGNVYPGLTLYDAWASAEEMEMPDVDVLGIVHDLTPDRRRWVAPIPAYLHDELYDHVGRLFAPARRYRALRTALSRCYLRGSVQLRDGYTLHLDRLHALWDAYASTPGELAAVLPDAAALETFLESWGLACEENPEIIERGRRRRAQLDLDAQAVRALLVRALERHGALERTARPAPAEKPKATKSSGG
jgi:hypothetical protein